ncbi:MAG TPA: type II toxin-antitoxin system RelB/DinJ family antitoxin [Campylobacterales bacterium]|nr:type II toxin-antitoxin system RelB/DinJ family antitoxin [Campylobacterales bacterium]
MRQTTSMKLDPIVKREAQEIFATLGLTLGEAVNLFLNQVRLRRGIPFDIEIPNAESQKIFHEIRKGKNIEEFSMDELKRG